MKISVTQLRWSPNSAAGMAFHPEIPIRPPASRLLLRLFQPVPGIGIQIIVDPMAALLAGRRVDDAGNVTAGSQHKATIASHQDSRAVGALPRHDMVLTRGQHIERYLYI